MLKRLVAITALAGSAILVPVTLAPASAQAAIAAAHTTGAVSACTYRRSGNTWRCITPGAYCPKAGHNRYGYAKVTNRRYKCSVYSNDQWRWKRI